MSARAVETYTAPGDDWPYVVIVKLDDGRTAAYLPRHADTLPQQRDFGDD